MILTVGGIKGGTGKTTAATNLAIMRRRAGRDVLIVDADEQRSASEFVAQREALGRGSIPCVQFVGKGLVPQVKDLSARYDDIVIDTGGRDTTSQRAALVLSDILLLPFKPGNFDLWTVEHVGSLVSEARAINDRLEALAFVSQGHPAGQDNREASELLGQVEGIRLLPVTVMNRKAFNNAAGQGLSVVELPVSDPKAVGEIGLLYRAIFEPAADAEAA